MKLDQNAIATNKKLEILGEKISQQIKTQSKCPAVNFESIFNKGDHILFIKYLKTRGLTALLIYVDYIIVLGNNQKEQLTLKQYLIKEFEIKELGKLKYFLEIEVVHSKFRIFIFQEKIFMT